LVENLSCRQSSWRQENGSGHRRAHRLTSEGPAVFVKPTQRARRSGV
jgi:hypothetical protein